MRVKLPVFHVPCQTKLSKAICQPAEGKKNWTWMFLSWTIHFFIKEAITTCKTCTDSVCALPIQSNYWVPLFYTKQLSTKVGSRPSERKVNCCFRGATPEQNPWERWRNIIKKKRPLAGTSNSCHNKQATEEFLESRIVHVKLLR